MRHRAKFENFIKIGQTVADVKIGKCRPSPYSIAQGIYRVPELTQFSAFSLQVT